MTWMLSVWSSFCPFLCMHFFYWGKHIKTISSESNALEMQLQTSFHHFVATKDYIKGLWCALLQISASSPICMRTILFSAATHPVPHSIQLMHQCEGILVHYQWKANKQLTGIVSSSKKHPFNLQSFWTLISGWKSCKSFHPCCNLLVLQVQENLCTQHTQNTKIRRNCDTNFAIIHPHQAFYP
jgi:hypothetical protein